MKAKLRAGKQGAKGRVKKYEYGGAIQPGTATPVSGMLGGLSALAKPGVTGSVSAQDRPSVPSSMGPMPTMQLPPGVKEKFAAMEASMGRPGVVQPGPRPGMGRPGMGRPGMGRPGMGRPGMGRPGMGRPGMGKPGTGGVNVGPRPTMSPMAAQQVMPEGRAFKKGGMVGCDWKAPSSKTMRGAARKGK